MIEELVYDYLCSHHRGKDNKIKNKDLRIKFGINSDKAMRKVIQNIREQEVFLELVGSESGVDGGFYICIDENEVQETIDNIKHRANQMLRMTHVLEWKRSLGGN